MPVDVGDGVEVQVEAFILSDLAVEPGHELGDLLVVVEVTPAVFVRSGPTHEVVTPACFAALFRYTLIP